MDKLKELFRQLGGSDELVEALSEELSRYGEELKEQYESYFGKLEKSKDSNLEMWSDA